ncbi:WSC-domain-containing protein [Mollisia scopiformis]|uniref:WSC-domain-containing protein n=1 Tax=Mollisia scopiformis TaxID=149040 RepID=A0A194XSR3_MOLSC|nr:WSC-domain-containing protein [Mollisia scopiformis]KUJ23079.1 WSC-domain-containing protein [Mollisia scopiformis]
MKSVTLFAVLASLPIVFAQSSSSSVAAAAAVSSSTYLPPSSVASVPLPSISPVGNYYYAGCYLEPPNARMLPYLVVAADNMTLEMCSSNCAGTYQYWGVEYGRECWCGYTLAAGTVETTTDQCNIPCGGLPTEMCGSHNGMSLYSSLSSIAPPYVPPPPPTPKIPQMAGPYTSLGCVTEASNYQRALTSFEVVNANMTNDICATACAGYTYFGTEYSNECKKYPRCS